MPDDICSNDKIAAPLTGTLSSAVITAALSELYGKEVVHGFIFPHLSENNAEGNYEVGTRFCSEVKRIPITMAVADILNEASAAGLEFPSAGTLQTMIHLARLMALGVVRDNGYLLGPSLIWGGGEEQILDMARQFDIPIQKFEDHITSTT